MAKGLGIGSACGPRVEEISTGCCSDNCVQFGRSGVDQRLVLAVES